MFYVAQDSHYEVKNGSLSLSQGKPSISPALETAIDYQLKILSVAISYGGPVLLRYKDQLKEAIVSAFDCPSWKVFVSSVCYDPLNLAKGSATFVPK